jgi:hypothetical protein
MSFQGEGALPPARLLAVAAHRRHNPDNLDFKSVASADLTVDCKTSFGFTDTVN